MNTRRELYLLCSAHVAGRIADIQATIVQIKEAIANDTKSSAGDKYETGREMLQQEINLNETNLAELARVKAILDNIATLPLSEVIGRGSVIHTDQGNYYMAAGMGSFMVNGQKYHSISPASPVGKEMGGLKKGDSFQFNKKKYRIIEVL